MTFQNKFVMQIDHDIGKVGKVGLVGSNRSIKRELIDLWFFENVDLICPLCPSGRVVIFYKQSIQFLDIWRRVTKDRFWFSGLRIVQPWKVSKYNSIISKKIPHKFSAKKQAVRAIDFDFLWLVGQRVVTIG